MVPYRPLSSGRACTVASLQPIDLYSDMLEPFRWLANRQQCFELECLCVIAHVTSTVRNVELYKSRRHYHEQVTPLRDGQWVPSQVYG